MAVSRRQRPLLDRIRIILRRWKLDIDLKFFSAACTATSLHVIECLRCRTTRAMGGDYRSGRKPSYTTKTISKNNSGRGRTYEPQGILEIEFLEIGAISIPQDRTSSRKLGKWPICNFPESWISIEGLTNVFGVFMGVGKSPSICLSEFSWTTPSPKCCSLE